MRAYLEEHSEPSAGLEPRPAAIPHSLAPALPPGLLQRKLARRAVQRRATGPDAGGAVHEVAAQGIKDPGGALPYLDRVQESFGHHDLSGVQAHVGGQAAVAAHQLGALAYATSDLVAFGQGPDLHTAAHEAAHVVQQRSGVQLKDGVGQAGDAYEQHADAVADRVVRGERAQDLLDQTGGAAQKSGPAIQRCPLQYKKKGVAGKAMARLGQAKAAIDHAKTVFAFGAGNQVEALKATNFNSYFRLKAMRDPTCWELADSVKALAAANPDSLTAAKADLAHGGNCGEHARVAFDYLRVHASGQTINRSAVDGLDHAFVIMGDLVSETDGDLVVSDPWPTAATATVWVDHFAFTADRKQIHADLTMVADGKDVKSVIAAGVKLSAKGLAMIQKKYSDKDTAEQAEKGSEGDHPWIWEQPDSAAEDKKYDYYKKK